MSGASKLGQAVDRALQPFVDIRPGEGLTVLSMAVFFFLATVSYYLVKPVRNSLFVERVGADGLPYVYIATAAVVGLLISWYSRHVVDRVRPRRLIPITYILVATNLVLFSWWIRHESLAASAAFYIWAKLYPVLVVSQFWLMANALFEPRQAKRLFGFVGAGGIVGGIAGGFLAAAIARAAGSENLLLASAVVITMCAGFAARLYPGQAPPSGAHVRTESPPAAKVGPRSAAALVRESPHLRAIANILTVAIVVSTVVDWQMNKAVELFISGEDAKTAFYGRFFAWLNGASFLVQVLLTSYVLKRFGISLALLLLPVGLLTGALGILVHPALWTAVIAKGIDGTLRYSLDQSTRELLFLPVPPAVKARAKPFLDVAVQRGGTGLAGIVILLATSVLGVPFQYVSLVTIVAIAVWISATFTMRREYVQSIKRLIDARDIEVGELVRRRLDADHRRQLLEALEGDDPERVLYALELLQLAGEVGPADRHLAKLLRHPSDAVRERAAAALAEYGDAVLLKAIQPLLEDEDTNVRARAAQLVCRHCVGDELKHFQSLLDDQRARVRAGAIAGYYGSPDPRLSQLAEAGLHNLASAPGPAGAVYRREAGLLTAILPPSEATRRILMRLLEDPEEEVRRAAIQAAGRGGHREAVPVLVRALAPPRRREEARAALTAFGPRILGTLSDHLRDRSEPLEIRTQLARIFAEVPSFLSVELLLSALDDPDPRVRHHILKSLNRLRRDHPELSFSAEPVERALQQELKVLIDVQATRAWLPAGPESQGPSLRQRVIEEREDDAVERITRCLGLIYPLDEVFHAYRAFATRTAEGEARSIELLDNVLRLPHRRVVIPLLEGLGRRPPERATEPSAAFLASDPWLAACLSFVEINRTREITSTEDLTMMTIVERVDFLRQCEMFAVVRTDYLAKIAALAKEKFLDTGDELFEQGSSPEAVYFVVEGEIRALRDGRELSIARRHDVLAVLPVLDRKPTLVTAVAVGPARVLFVEDEVFNDLMLDNPTILLGIVRFLAGELRRLQSATRGEAVLAHL